jgi:DNA helicase-2/ATP-dependent DNA helicase PcrA
MENAKHRMFAELAIGNVLATAPAGCGKTEALALRAKVIRDTFPSNSPQKILAVTYSNKARDNLASRMRRVVGPLWRARIEVTNFHGLCARIIRAHGAGLGLTPSARFPEKLWRQRTCREVGVTYRNSDRFEAALRGAKRVAVDDESVMEAIEASGNPHAVDFERRLRAEGRLDYDDVLRHGARLLGSPGVSRLYQAHFAAVLVDEIQDLSTLYLDIVRGVGGDAVTYVGDLAQGIYSFAGAEPVEVMDRIMALRPTVMEFDESYRASPAVLNAINSLADLVGAPVLRCAEPDRWPNAGSVVYLERSSSEQEAEALLERARRILEECPSCSIGVIVRRGTRLNALRRAAEAAGMAFEDWTAATHIPRVSELVRKYAREAASKTTTEAEALSELETLCKAALDPADVSTADEVASACEDLRNLVETGMSLLDAVDRCRVSTASGEPVAAGVHLLTGHAGKGQEFDWVFVVGLEEGHIPDFRSANDPEELRVLHVMLSRAKQGLLFTYCSRANPAYDASTSRWLASLRSVATANDIA